MRRTLLTATFLVGCLCSAFTAAREPQASPQLPSRDTDTFTISNDDVTRILRERVDQMHKGVGIVVGLVDRTGTRVISYGTTDRKNHRPVNGDSVFEIGSLTKLFTGILLADMVDRGEVRLDDPISKYLPDSVRAPTRNGKEITLAHLSTHTSGLPRMPGNFGSLWWRLCPWCSDASGPYSRYSVEQMYRFLSGYTLKHDIGAKSEYSNYAVALLGQILARRAGTDYATLVRTRITQPLGMSDTALRPTPEMQVRLASGFHDSLKPAPSWDLSGAFAAAGGLLSTTNDLLKFAAANVNLRQSPVLAAMQRSHLPSEASKMQMGLGWGIARRCGTEVRSHTGGTGGYTSYLGIDLKRRRGVVVLTNTTNEIPDLFDHLLERQVPVLKDHRQAITLNDNALDAYVGVYRLQPDAVLILTRRGDRLFSQRTGGKKMEMFATTDTEFFAETFNAPFTFVKDGGRVTQVVIHYQCGVDERGQKIK